MTGIFNIVESPLTPAMSKCMSMTAICADSALNTLALASAQDIPKHVSSVMLQLMDIHSPKPLHSPLQQVVPNTLSRISHVVSFVTDLHCVSIIGQFRGTPGGGHGVDDGVTDGVGDLDTDDVDDDVGTGLLDAVPVGVDEGVLVMVFVGLDDKDSVLVGVGELDSDTVGVEVSVIVVEGLGVTDGVSDIDGVLL